MSLQRLCIVLDNPNGVYFPGQTVSGIIEFWIAKPKKIRGLFLEVKGSSSVHWTETRSRSQGTGNDRRTVTETVHYRSEENYLDQKLIIVYEGGSTFEVAPNNYQYPFSFVLPQYLPSSFEGEYGRIRYTIKAKVDRPWAFDYEFKAPFTVNTLIDLNTNEMAGQRTQGTDIKTLGCCCCASGPISARAWLDTTGYVPGQNIAFCADVENQSGKIMKSSKVKFIQYCHFFAQGKSKTTTNILAELKRGGFAESETWDHVPIPVPPVVPSDLPFCHNIRVDYKLEFFVNPGTFSFNMKIPLDLIIGNVPLRQHFTQFVAPTAPLVENFWQSLPPAPNFQPYQDLPPPSYEEATFSADIREEGDANKLNYGFSTQYAPRYLTYQYK